MMSDIALLQNDGVTCKRRNDIKGFALCRFYKNYGEIDTT